jgi:hypothetical protein
MSERNLVLVHTENFQAKADIEEIAGKARALDPATEVSIVDNRVADDRLAEDLAARPSLVFSPIQLLRFKPRRGAIFEGGPVDKLTQYRRFLQHGIGTPKTAQLVRGMVLTERDWGEYVVLKPLSPRLQSTGQSVYRIATKRLNHDLNFANLFPRYNLPGGVVVQSYVDAGDRLEYHRVLALFGEPLYVLRTRLQEPMVLEAHTGVTGTVPLANLGFTRAEKTRDYVSDPLFFDLAAACYKAFPDRALQAVDVLRDHATGAPYVLEANLGGNSWHFSSKLIQHRLGSAEAIREAAAQKIGQFGAFDVAARVLIEQTRRHAR